MRLRNEGHAQLPKIPGGNVSIRSARNTREREREREEEVRQGGRAKEKAMETLKEPRGC